MNILESINKTVGTWNDALLANLPTILEAFVALVGFYFLAKIGQLIVSGISQRSGAPHSLQILIGKITKIVIVIIGLVVALSTLGLGEAVTTTLAGAGIIGIVLGFALQDIAANFISGVVLIFRKPFRDGDLIEVSDQLGTVEEINLRTTKLHALNGPVVHIPNRKVFADKLTNYSELGQRRIDISCGVSYSDDLDKARHVATQAIEALDFADTEKHEVEVYYEEFADSTINFTLRFWIDFERQPNFLAGRSAAIEAIKTAFVENDIDMPFPIQTLEFNPKGGSSLRDQLSSNQ